MSKIAVTLAYPWQGPDGTNHRADTTVRVDDATGRDLILRGRARPADRDAAPAGADEEGSTS